MTAHCSNSALYSPLPHTTEPCFVQPPLLKCNHTPNHAWQHPTIPTFSPPPWSVSSVFSKHFCFLSEPPKKTQTNYPDIFSLLFPLFHSGQFNTWTTVMPIQTSGVKVCTPWPLITLALPQWLSVNSPYWAERLINLVCAACRKGIVPWQGRCQGRMRLSFFLSFFLSSFSPCSVYKQALCAGL